MTLRILELEAEIKALTTKLERCMELSAVECVKQVKSIESRGNIRCNLRNGDVDLLRPLDFVPRRNKEEPIAEYVDLNIAEPVIQDLAELAKMFHVPMVVEGHT